jgi:hypothetical protein
MLQARDLTLRHVRCLSELDLCHPEQLDVVELLAESCGAG